MYEETLSRIRRFIESRPEDSAAYGDYFDIVRAMWEADKNVHDDAPDSLAMLADELYHGSAQIEIKRRTF